VEEEEAEAEEDLRGGARDLPPLKKY